MAKNKKIEPVDDESTKTYVPDEVNSRHVEMWEKWTNPLGLVFEEIPEDDKKRKKKDIK